MEAGGMVPIVAELRAEQAVLDELVAGLAPDQWLLSTPAPGWDVRDSVSHLAAIDELALECVEGRHEAAFARAGAAESPEAFGEALIEPGRSRSPEEVLAWWRAARERLSDALLALDPADRVVWGAGPMAARSFATARIMECWAHGLDCFAAVEVEPAETDRLRHVCHLAYRALPYAFRVAGRPMPAPLEELRIDVEPPGGGEPWGYGPEDAPQRITGSAGEWARVAVQRMPASAARTLEATGPLAEQALEVARAFV